MNLVHQSSLMFVVVALTACASESSPVEQAADAEVGPGDAAEITEDVAPDAEADTAPVVPDTTAPEVVERTCDRAGYSGQTFYVDEPDHVAFAASDGLSVLYLQFNKGPQSPFAGVGTYAFASTDADRSFNTCVTCPFLMTDCATGECQRLLYATSGQLRVAALDAAQGTFEVVVEDAIFDEVDFRGGVAGEPLTDGERWCMPNTTLARKVGHVPCDSDADCAGATASLCNPQFGLCGGCRSSQGCPSSQPVCVVGDEGPMCVARGDVCLSDDAFEPNDVRAQATPVALPTSPLEGTACYSDWFVFTTSITSTIALELEWIGAGSLALALHDASGDVLARADAGGARERRVTWDGPAGTYYASIVQSELAVLEGAVAPPTYSLAFSVTERECEPGTTGGRCDDGDPCTIDRCDALGACVRDNPCNAPAGRCVAQSATTYSCACSDPDAIGPACLPACPGGQHLDGDAYEPNECAAQATRLTVTDAGDSPYAHTFTLGPQPSDVDWMRGDGRSSWMYWVLTSHDGVCPIARELLAPSASGSWRRAGQISHTALQSGWSCAMPAGGPLADYRVAVVGFQLDPDFGDVSFDATPIPSNRTSVANALGNSGDEDAIEFEADLPFTLRHTGQGVRLRAQMYDASNGASLGYTDAVCAQAVTSRGCMSFEGSGRVRIVLSIQYTPEDAAGTPTLDVYHLSW